MLATEVSRPTIARLSRSFEPNPGFRAVHDPEGSTAELGLAWASLIVFASVLHHVPDYLAMLARRSRHLPPAVRSSRCRRLGRAQHLLSEAPFLSWRVTRGNLTQGVKTRLRRLSGRYDDTNPSDVAEYRRARRGPRAGGE